MLNFISNHHQINNVNKATLLKRVSFADYLSQIKHDSLELTNPFIDKEILIAKGIILPEQNINQFFEKLSEDIFSDTEKANLFAKNLKNGLIALSTSCLMNIKKPASAVAFKFDSFEAEDKRFQKIQDCIEKNLGIGINFNEAISPSFEILKINSFAKKIGSKRPPALIGLLKITHPDILNFITLKDNANFDDWCFDLSVIIPNDFLAKVDKNEAIMLDNGQIIEARKIYNTLLKSMLKKGEPGIIFSSNEDYLCDCCGCCELNQNDKLTLGHINLSNFYNVPESRFDFELLKKSTDILCKAMLKIDSNSKIGVFGYQDMLNKAKLQYGETCANILLENILKEIQIIAHNNDLKTAISPTGSISRVYRTSPSIEPVGNSKMNYYNELDTLISAQKYIDENISKTLLLKKNADLTDIDNIVRYSFANGIKGITVFPEQ